VVRKLGQGRYGLVKLGVSEQDERQVAIKIVNKTGLAEEERDCIKTEVEVMAYINHINVIRLQKVVENRLSICMFIEFAGGGELFEHIIRQTKLSEPEARKFFVQMLDGLGYCHERMIVHRDIKAENSMYQLSYLEEE
jgi:serine/threonine protein kinase